MKQSSLVVTVSENGNGTIHMQGCYRYDGGKWEVNNDCPKEKLYHYMWTISDYANNVLKVGCEFVTC